MAVDERGAVSDKDFEYHLMRTAMFDASNLYRGELGRRIDLQTYLHDKRGLSPSTVTHFGIGYAPRSWEFIIRNLHEVHGYKKELLEKVGLMTIRTGEIEPEQRREYDCFIDRIVIPLTLERREQKEVVGFIGRILPGSNEEYAKYVNTRSTPLFEKGKYLFNLTQEALIEARRAGYLLITEGPLDVMQAWQSGIKNVVAVCGTALTPDHLELLARKRLEGVRKILVFDGDSAGLHAAERALEANLKEMLEVVELPEGKDLDDMLRENPYGAETIQAYAKYARSGFDFLFARKYDLVSEQNATRPGTLEGKVEILNLLKPAFEKVPLNKSGILIDELASRLNIQPDSVANFMYPVRTADPSYSSQPLNHSSLWQAQLVRLLVQLKGDSHMIEYCVKLGAHHLLKGEARLAFDYLEDARAQLPLLNDPLFSAQARKQIVSEISVQAGKKEIVFDADTLESMFETSRIMYPTGERRVLSQHLLDRAIFELLIPEAVRGLRESYLAQKISVARMANLTSRIKGRKKRRKSK